MAFEIGEVRRIAERVAASHHMEVVDVEFGGGGKSRALRVYLEKDAAERARLKERGIQTLIVADGDAGRNALLESEGLSRSPGGWTGSS